jgi:hypothetical protein
VAETTQMMPREPPDLLAVDLFPPFLSVDLFFYLFAALPLVGSISVSRMDLVCPYFLCADLGFFMLSFFSF